MFPASGAVQKLLNLHGHRLCFPRMPPHYYHAPFLRPNHQTNPSVAVFCSFFNTPGVSVKKNGLLDQSRRYSPRSRNSSLNLYSAVTVISFKSWSRPVNNDTPSSDRLSPTYSNRPANAKPRGS